ncbi:molybdenum cofactor guanylyltransferase [Paenibacillus sp. XY044]|uniref:molybdenum cofactor guanylyltransferase n=1 Tax=Paenibacillus sp. XY044 TaxID=2026089 RepID=UPI000B990D1E|nr:molybdenum cofactor guanylyltransferase [Paenibacillus sp. XY044]OZB91227.1 molybdenum cofactor guanylyltransferase [Paenibacillus sp. XY044]
MLSGVILAGGDHGSAKGEPSVFQMFQGETLLQRQIREMRKCCGEITIVTDDPRPFLRQVDRDIRIITDYYIGKGMLGGMHSGLSLSKHRIVWIIGCHMPYPSADAAELMALRLEDGLDAVLPRIGGRLHPLHGIYDRSCSGYLGQFLDSGHSDADGLVHQLRYLEIGEADFRYLGIDGGFVRTLGGSEEEALPEFLVDDGKASKTYK